MSLSLAPQTGNVAKLTNYGLVHCKVLVLLVVNCKPGNYQGYNRLQLSNTLQNGYGCLAMKRFAGKSAPFSAGAIPSSQLLRDSDLSQVC
jgi:hypothetical protein